MTRRPSFRYLKHQGIGEGATPFSGLLPFTLDLYLIMLSDKRGVIMYHFISFNFSGRPCKSSWSNLPLTRSSGTRFYLTCHPRNFRGTSAGKNLRPVQFRRKMHFLLYHPRNLCVSSAREQPVYFRKQVHFLVFHPCNLCGMSKGSSSQYPIQGLKLHWIKGWNCIGSRIEILLDQGLFLLI